MVAKYGMSDSIGPVSYAGGQEVFIGRDYEKTKPYSEQTAGQIDAQVQKIMREAYQRCEQILRDCVVADPSWSVVLLRYFNPIGAHPSGLIGEDPRGVPNNLMPYISQTAIGRLECLNVFGDDYDTPDGTGVRDYIHVMDLARGHVSAIAYMAAHTGESIFNLGTGRGYSVLEMVHAFEAANHVHVPYRIAPRRAGDLPTVYACPDKSARILGWRADYSLEDMCRDSWRSAKALRRLWAAHFCGLKPGRSCVFCTSKMKICVDIRHKILYDIPALNTK